MAVTIIEDHSGFADLEKEMNRTSVEVGWLDNVEHWASDGNPTIMIPWLASHLHYYSPWEDSFMFSQTRTKQVDAVVQAALHKGMAFNNTAIYIGKQLEARLKKNIESVTSPSNDPKWAAKKGNNKPLQWGSLNGNTPNLISSISSVVKR